MLVFNLLAQIVFPLHVLLDIYLQCKRFKFQLEQIEEDKLDPHELRIHVEMLLDQRNN
jgi:hypothetical protein